MPRTPRKVEGGGGGAGTSSRYSVLVGLSPGWWLVVAPHPVPGSVYIADSNVGLQDCLNQGFLELACRIRVVLDTMRGRASHDQPRWMERFRFRTGSHPPQHYR